MDAINLLASIALPTSFGAPAVPLQPGQVVHALVLELLQSGAVRLQLPQALLDVRSDVRLTPGGTVTLAVKGSGAALKLDILGHSSAPGAPLGDVAAGQVLRRPIGEAIIVGRAGLPETPAAAPTVPSPAGVTPARALAEAVRIAAARQGGLGPLFTDAAQAAQVATLPAQVRAALRQLLALRIPLGENLTAADVKEALTRSGVLLEPRLAAAVASAPSAVPPADDLKAALLVLRQALKTWAGDVVPASASLSAQDAEGVARSVATALLAKPAPSSANAGPPPPYRGAPLTPQPPVPAAIDTSSPPATAERLIAATDAALSRQTLLQAASLPDAASLDASHDSGPRWTFEVPFTAGQGTAILPFEIARDGHRSSVEPQSAPWRVRFSLDIEPMGPVHALVTLSGDRAGVTLWAERHATAARLNDHAPLLGDALRAAQLQPGELAFRVGTPRAAKPAAPGRFMDRAS